MSTERNVSQVQKMFTEWQGNATEQVGKVVDFWSELGRGVANPIGVGLDATKVFRESVEQISLLTRKNLEHGQAVAAALLELSRESFQHAAKLATEMHRIQLGALEKSRQVFVQTPASN